MSWYRQLLTMSTYEETLWCVEPGRDASVPRADLNQTRGGEVYVFHPHHALYDRRKRQISFRFRVPPARDAPRLVHQHEYNRKISL